MADKGNPDVGQDVNPPGFDENTTNGHTSETSVDYNGGEAVSAADAIDWKAQAAYMGAEVENMKKRFLREASDIRKYANEDLLKRIVPSLDNLNLALKAAARAKDSPDGAALASNKAFTGFVQGVEMTAKKFEQTLETAGVEFIKTVGETFDPQIHEAIGQAIKPEIDENIITEEFERGFRLFGRVVRPAKVFVNKH